MRQKGDMTLIDLLNNVREGKLSETECIKFKVSV